MYDAKLASSKNPTSKIQELVASNTPTKKPGTTKKFAFKKIMKTLDECYITASKNKEQSVNLQVAKPAEEEAKKQKEKRASTSNTFESECKSDAMSKSHMAEEIKTIPSTFSTVVPISMTASTIPVPVHYVNNHPKHCSFVNSNPVIVIVSILNDLVLLLNKSKSKGPEMFHVVKKLPQFELVEKEAASLRVILFSNL